MRKLLTPEEKIERKRAAIRAYNRKQRALTKGYQNNDTQNGRLQAPPGWTAKLPRVTEENAACSHCGQDNGPSFRKPSRPTQARRYCGECGKRWDPCPSLSQIEKRCAVINANRPTDMRNAHSWRICKVGDIRCKVFT